MKFTELNEKAKLVAIKDYIAGWEDEKDEKLSLEKGRELCIDSEDDVNYYPDGTLSLWERQIFEPKEDGDLMLFANWTKDITEIEITKYYDEDLDKYDDEFSVFRQIEYEKGSWKGDEIGTFKTLKEAMDYAEEVVADYGDDY